MRTRVKFASWGKRLVLAPALATALVGPGCTNDAADQNKSNILLTVESVDTNGDFLLSDISVAGAAVNDNATLKIRNSNKNPLQVTTSNYSDAMMQRYTVSYFRSDGRNAEGVDVPYSFQGALAGIVPVGSSVDMSLVLVRHQAKLEPPLSQLRGLGGAVVMTAFAKITIFGETISGDVVSAEVNVSVTFADFPDN
jgi:hypothetical protein